MKPVGVSHSEVLIALLVEDEPHMRGPITYELEDAGLSVLTVETGEAALAILRDTTRRIPAPHG